MGVAREPPAMEAEAGRTGMARETRLERLKTEVTASLRLREGAAVETAGVARGAKLGTAADGGGRGRLDVKTLRGREERGKPGNQGERVEW